jgi:hypothetical protein
MEVLTEVSGVGAEVEAEMTIADTVAGGTAQTTEADEMATITEVVVELAHALGAQIGTLGVHEETGAIVTMQI